MAPGRKRGAKGAKTKGELRLGDLVLAKVKGFPAWPAKISRPEDWERVPDPKKFFVQFFGTAEIAFVTPADIQAFTIEAKNKLLARCQSKTVKHFSQAVKEICEAFEELQKKSSSGEKDDIDRAGSGTLLHRVLDDGVVIGLEAINLADGPGRNTDAKGLGDHGGGLERCSWRRVEMDGQEIKPRISSKTNNESPVISLTIRHTPSKNEANFPKKEVSASSPCNVSRSKKEVFCDKETEDTVNSSKNTKTVTHIGALNASKNSSLSDTEGKDSGGMIFSGKDSSSVLSVPAKYLDSGKKAITNGHKSKKTITGSKKNTEGDVRKPKNTSFAAMTSSLCDENLKDEVRKRAASGVGMRETLSGSLRSDRDAVSRKKAQQFLKDSIHLEAVDDLQKGVEGSFKGHEKGDHSGKIIRSQVGHGKHNLVTDEVSYPVKRSESADVADSAKGSLQKNRKCGFLDNKAGNVEFRKSISLVKAENRLVSGAGAGSFDSNISGDEDVLPPSKRRRRAQEAMSGSSTIASDEKTGKGSIALRHDLVSDKIKSPVTQLPAKRRAVRLYDDEDDEEPKTPVHGGSVRKLDVPSRVLNSAKNTSVHSEHFINEQSSCVLEDGSSKPFVSTATLVNEFVGPHQHGERPKKAVAAHVSCNAGKIEFDKISSKEVGPDLVSPRGSPLLVAADKPVIEPLKANKPLIKVPGNVSQRKSQGSKKNSDLVSDSLNDSLNQVTNERSKSHLSGERQKSTPKSSSRISDSFLVAEKHMESNSLPIERRDKEREDDREDKASLLADSKTVDSVMSMKHLIAVAQAKRREAHSESLFHVSSNSDVNAGSPSLVSSVQPILGSSNMMQSDVQGYFSHASLASPSSHIHQFSSNTHPESEEFEDRRVSSGHHAAGGSLSGGTEAAVARDAFEGMIETLSRTKESIGRATRLAIDCAKYGIASEVVELLIHKLESEPSLHRKVDLFFLVDSITQCSHSHKGIAGASYIPTVQAALPRLLGAAAPPGAGARENRRQCLKVLRLWLERKILPESLLRRYMDDIGSSNDDTSAGFFLKRPSRAERAVDDPIREMEGMLVDEYGSNATFQLPGFLPSRVFEEDDEEEQELPSSSYKADDDRAAVELNCTVGEAETCIVTPNDRRHCILEDVDGELEMEDVSGHLKDERAWFTGVSFEVGSRVQDADWNLEAAPNCLTVSPESSPPIPLDSPPLTPPLPSSPPSPPPPPLSPSPPPPPPPPLPFQARLQPPPPAGMPPSFVPQSSLPPQPAIVSQHLHPFQSSLPSSPKLGYQPLLPHEYCGTPSGSQLVQVAGNPPHAHIDVSIRSEMFPQASHPNQPFQLAGYNSGRPLDYGRNDLYTNPQASQPNQPFQSGNLPLMQRAFHPAPPAPPAPIPSSHFSYSKPAVQHPQHLYPPSYSLPNHPDGPRRYVTDEKWKTPSNEYNTDTQHGLWVNGGRNASSPMPPFPQEGYFQPPLERPANNVGFQPSAVNVHPAGAPIPGHGGPQMVPSRPDMSSVGCWRSA